MDRLWIEPKYESLLAAENLESCQAVAGYFLASVASSRAAVVVRPGGLGDAGSRVAVFFKQYTPTRFAGRFWLRASKARREFENYAVFSSLGIPAAERVACGEERSSAGLLKRAFIITCAVPNAVTLVEFFNRCPGPPRATRLEVCRQLAGITRRLHGAGFFHNDLVWRNILVTEDAAEPKLWLIDCPRGRFATFGRSRRQLRDLASLDKSAAQFCTRAERLRFLLLYLKRAQVDDEAKRLGRQCLAYRQRRWPEDWDGK